MPKWTEQQQNAIDARGSNILVSAAAGSGKTAVLVERVVNMITKERVPVDRLLIVTFTNAAAAEMRSRISAKLSEIISENPNDTNAKRQLSLLPSAKICTIDSFCINLVRENFFNLNIERDFTIMDDSERQIVEQNVLDTLIGEKYEQGDDEFLELVEILSSSKNDKTFATTVSDISNFVTSQAFSDIWLDKACEIYDPDIPLEKSICAQYVFEETKRVCDFAFELIKSSLSSLSSDDEVYDKLVEIIKSDKEVFEKIANAVDEKNWDDAMYYVNNTSFARMTQKASPYKEIVSKNRNIYKNLLSKSLAPLYCVDTADYLDDCMLLYPFVSLLTQTVKEFNARTLEVKKELNSYTFSDIEHFAIELLARFDENGNYCKTELAKELEKSFDEILIDEYQDTNAAQDTLFSMLSNGKNRFMVGDIKQSIYRFRLAMPQIFSEKKESFADYESGEKSDSYKICLSNNFRSRQGICELTNFVFSKVMSKTVGGIDYNDDERLNFNAAFDPTENVSAVLALIETPEDADTDEYEAHQIAKMIISKVENREQVTDKSGKRDITFGDFAILFRSVKNRLPVFTRVFAEYGIPTVSNNKVNLFSNNEIVILINLLRAVDNPVQDIPLLATLMSVFFGYSAEDIAKAKVDYPASNLYTSISKSKDFERVIDELDKYRQYAASMSVENLLRQIISQSSYLSVISAMGNAEQRTLNVMKLVDIAKRFDNGENVGLTAFIRYVDNIISNNYDVESAVVSNINSNAVSMMTIHQSKGLEFPVCILAGSCHRYNFDDLKGLVQLNSSLGIGLKGYNENMLYRYNSLQYSIIRDKNNYELMSENLRVLYVAITRAKEQFITVYSAPSIEKKVASLSKNIVDGKISPSVVKSILCDGDIMLTTALMHKSCKALRDMCDDEIKVDAYADFDMEIVFPRYEISEKEVESVVADCSNELVEQIDEKLSFTYPSLEISSFASKRTASSLDEKENSFEHLTSSRPAFLNEGNMTSAQKGTAMHTFMQYCDYNASRQDLSKEINRLKCLSYLDEQQAASLNTSALEKFFNGTFASRMFKSNKIYREIKVASFVPVCEIENTDFQNPVLVQGISDCVFEENGELVVVDYKTDRVENEQQLLERYISQLMFYKSAVSKTLKKPVKQVVLYSFYLNKECIYK